MNAESIDGRRFTQGFLAVLAIGLAVAYGNSFSVGFYFDDANSIAENPAIRSLANIPAFFTDPSTSTASPHQVDLRPVLVTTYALNYAVSGTEPWSYHAFNLLLHLITSVLVFFVVRDHLWWPVTRRGPEGTARWPAAAAALFFAFAPVNNQALNFMGARAELLGTMFYVSAFLALLRGRLIAATVLHLLALFSTPLAFTVPFVFVLYDFFYRDHDRHHDFPSWLRDWKELLVPLAPLLAADVLYLVYRTVLLPPSVMTVADSGAITPWVWFMSQWSALLVYVKMFLWPDSLSIVHDLSYTRSFADFGAWGALLLISAWIGVALRYSWLVPHVAFATCWFFLTTAPQSTFWPSPQLIVDHRAYLASSLGLSVLLAWLLERAARVSGPKRRLTAFCLVAAGLCLVDVAAGNRRTADWSSTDRLWESAVRSSPNNGRAWINAGSVHLDRGSLKEARRYFERARGLLPASPDPLLKLSEVELAEPNPAQARVWAEQAVRLDGGLAANYQQLGKALEAEGRLGDAIKEYRRASALDPGNSSAKDDLNRLTDVVNVANASKTVADRMNDGVRLLDSVGDPEAALVEFRAVLDEDPAHFAATWQLARALDAVGRPLDAVHVWQRLLVMTRESNDRIAEAHVRERLSRE